MATVSAMFTITDTGDLSGRNLLQRSFFTKDPWTGPTYNAVGDGFGTYHDKECLPVTTNYLHTNTNKGVNNLFPDLTFAEGVQYTISGKWAQFRTDTKYNMLYFTIHHTDGTTVSTKQPGQNNTWLSFKLTSTAGKTVDKITTTYSNGGITYIADFKLEVGAAATDWTPAPEDVNDTYITANYAKNEIDGLEVGGRNILKHSDQANVIRRYSNSVINTESNVVVDEWRTNSGIRYYGNAGTSKIFGLIGGGGYTYQNTYYYLDRPYTLSAYVKNLSETSKLRFVVNGTAVTEAVEIAPLEQKRVIYVYSKPSTASVVQFTLYVDNAGDSFDFVMWHPQIEYGNRVTDWTPAPEDVEEAINSKNSVYYQATTPTAHKVGDTWFDTANDYKIRRWNGSTWAAAELGNQAVGNLDASHINTGTLTAVHIESGKAQDIAGTIKVYDENDAVKVSLDKDGLMATKGKIGGWNITSNSIEYDDGTAPTDSTVITDPVTGEELIEEGQPGLVGGRTILKLCTYDSSYPDAGPQLISATYSSSNVAEDSTLRIGSGGLSCYYNRNNGVTGGSLSLSPKLINVINADYDEDQVLWTDSANLNPGSLTIIMSKKENGERTVMGRSFLTYRDLAFVGDADNPQLASGIAHWSVLSSERTVKDTLKVTVYHCGNLFWAHFYGTIPAGWTAGNTQNVLVPIITGDTDSSNSALVAPPDNLTKYIIPTDLTNMRISVTVRSDGQLGISRVAEPFKGNATTTIAGYMETCDIFWAHIG